MKYCVLSIGLMLPVVAFGVVETVVGPQFVEYTSSQFVEPQYDILENLIDRPRSTTTETENLDELVITTEIGTTVIPTGSGAIENADPLVELDQVVAQINADYIEAEAACSTGSWLSNTWCRVKSWF